MTRCKYERNQGIRHSQTLHHIFYFYILLITYLHTHDIDLLSMPHYFSARVITLSTLTWIVINPGQQLGQGNINMSTRQQLLIYVNKEFLFANTLLVLS